MYIVIVGGGKVGYHLTKSLLADGQEVLLIERDATKADRIIRDLGATTIHGDGAELATLDGAGLERADVVAAVTGDDEDNLIICQVAKGRFQVPRTVARVNNPRNEHIFRELGIDVTVSATQIILATLQQSIPHHTFIHLLTLQEGGIELVEVLLEENSSAIGRRAGDLALPADTAVPLLLRDGKPMVVQGDTLLQAHDRLLALTTAEHEMSLRQEVLGVAV